LKNRFGDQLFFIGGIDSSREITFGNPESIAQHVQSQIHLLGENYGYIPGPAHDLLDVPLDNALAMRDAIHEFGRIPDP
jgi:uroporphyrinogen-III decarboxylase